MRPGPLPLPDETDTRALARRIAPALRAGDVLLLEGPVGAGKTSFARALIRARLGDETAEVPSPTFTLVQTYDDGECEIWHADLYRLGHPDEVLELGLGEAFGTAIVLVEWPERLGTALPAGALRLGFAAEADGHSVRIDAPGAWSDRLAALA
ncbi:tRNA (adenosine(37)-N6)-threonylcarbamoyltransferase complex ATPase subunit type 1 TsaE [Wenxinia saemankumensis]|uniref:tRNA threonylcarbamoyladenosine biosynthesis protein TsaE n=1 Tax=Wenxinia saemankumensis TaxID=1447782 RepID=A0A1M6G3B4_9RHOB|nr:tRNA (adenosine(37)-N6)-threonylcarbamoyltransferase complex ATPase subunit type 1 TsaE [Wenxinia saemankumensis]SHJ04400.1 tRNA threonylcarbamoyladenosine biosynthesis protein TsaE [Wenxinia saemankumensis]